MDNELNFSKPYYRKKLINKVTLILQTTLVNKYSLEILNKSKND